MPSTVVSAKATDTLGSDTPGKDLRRALRSECGESDHIEFKPGINYNEFIVTFINIIRPTYPLFL